MKIVFDNIVLKQYNKNVNKPLSNNKTKGVTECGGLKLQ